MWFINPKSTELIIFVFMTFLICRVKEDFVYWVLPIQEHNGVGRLPGRGRMFFSGVDRSCPK